jgi:hypothetical protein
LEAGNHTLNWLNYRVKLVYSSFEILDFDIEKQFVNADLEKLSQLATVTKEKGLFSDQVIN